MVLEQIDEFNKLAEACGSTYLAVNFISNAARWVKSEGCPLEMSQIVSKVVSDSPTFYENYPRKLTIPSELDYLNYVEDTEIAEEVIRMYSLSIRAKHLIYDTETNISYFKKSRAKVILNMIWYSMIEDSK